jgi:hypothetical protein
MEIMGAYRNNIRTAMPRVKKVREDGLQVLCIYLLEVSAIWEETMSDV